MPFVIDANILFSALIKEGPTAEVLVNNMGALYAPEFILEEFREHKAEILRKTKRTSEDFEFLSGLLGEIITVVPYDEYRDMVARAEEIAPDPDDVPYFALALKMEIPIWSNDKQLKKQDSVQLYNTEELL